MESEAFLDPNPLTFKVWSWCLLNATHEERTFMRSGKRVTLKPGQFYGSIRAIASKVKASHNTVRNVLKRLQNWEQLEAQVKDHTGTTIYQITNWEKYQSEEQVQAQLEAQRRHRSGTLNNNDKNDKNNPPTPSAPKPTKAQREAAARLEALLRTDPRILEVIAGFCSEYRITINSAQQEGYAFAAVDLLKLHTENTIFSRIKLAKKILGQEYAPQIRSLPELLAKWAMLEGFEKKENGYQSTETEEKDEFVIGLHKRNYRKV